MKKQVNAIAGRLSLRAPQREALEILDRVTEIVPPKKGTDSDAALATIRAEYPGVTAAVPWYGHVKRTYPDAPGVDAFSLVSRIKAPVLGLYGEADTGIAPEDVKRFEAELRKTNPSVEFVLYPGAPHAFFSDDRPQVYKKDAAEDAWKRCLAFFDRHLKG